MQRFETESPKYEGSKAKPLPPLNILTTRFVCDAKNGILKRRTSGYGCKAGDEVGWTDVYGYRIVSIDARNYRVHRIIYKMVHGSFDERLTVDHINGNSLDNRITNLQAKSFQENAINKRTPTTNKSGVCGVCIHKNTGMWSAEIQKHYIKYHLGYFKNFDEAKKARKQAEALLDFHPNHGRI